MAVLMLCTSVLYFAVAIYGERFETKEAHGLESQSEAQTTESHNESQESGIDTTKEGEQTLPQAQEGPGEIHNESNESPVGQLQEVQREERTNETSPTQETQNTEGQESKHVESKEVKELHHETASENQRRNLESPLSVSASIGYAVVGLWMILDKRNSKLPYFIAIAGSLILLGIYVASRTVSIFSLGLEPVGLLDLVVGMLQGGIIVGSSYILITRTYALRE